MLLGSPEYYFWMKPRGLLPTPCPLPLCYHLSMAHLLPGLPGDKEQSWGTSIGWGCPQGCTLQCLGLLVSSKDSAQQPHAKSIPDLAGPYFKRIPQHSVGAG